MRSSTEACAVHVAANAKVMLSIMRAGVVQGHGRHWSDNRAKEQDDRAAGFNRDDLSRTRDAALCATGARTRITTVMQGQKQSLPQCFHAKHLHLLHPRSATFSSDQPPFTSSSACFRSVKLPLLASDSSSTSALSSSNGGSRAYPLRPTQRRSFAVRNITQCIIQTSSAKST